MNSEGYERKRIYLLLEPSLNLPEEMRKKLLQKLIQATRCPGQELNPVSPGHEAGCYLRVTVTSVLHYQEFEVSTAVKDHFVVLWGMTPFSVVGGHKCFGRTYCLLLQGRTLLPEMAFCDSLPDCTVSFLTRPQYKRQIMLFK
jgi:hypothetical protein